MVFDYFQPSLLVVEGGAVGSNGNLSEEDRQTISSTYDDIKLISAYYPIFLCGLGVPSNFLTIRILLSSPSLRKNFVSVFLMYLSFYNVMNTIIGLSQFWFYGMFDFEIATISHVFNRLYTSIIIVCHMVVNWILTSLSLCKILYIVYPHEANIWCGRGVTHAVMLMILLGSLCFHVIITEGGKKVVVDERIPRDFETHYLNFEKSRAVIQSCIFFYVPGGLILIVNFTIILLYTRTRKSVVKASRTFARHLKIAYRFAVITLLCDIQIILMEFPYAYFYTEGYEWRHLGPVEAARANFFYCVAAMMLYTNYSMNFIVYCFFGNYYRRELYKIFRPCLKKVVATEAPWIHSSESDDSDFALDNVPPGNKTLRATASLKNLFHDYTESKRVSSKQSILVSEHRHHRAYSSPVDARRHTHRMSNVSREMASSSEYSFWPFGSIKRDVKDSGTAV